MTWGIRGFIQSVGGGKVRAVMESTGTFWYSLYSALEENGVYVSLANPLKTRLIAEAKIKSDRIDASVLSDLLRANLIVKSYVPPREIKDVRALLRQRETIVRTKTMVKNRIHAILDKHNIKAGFSDMFGRDGLKWLRDIDLPSVDRLLLDTELQELDNLNGIVDKLDFEIASRASRDSRVELLMGEVSKRCKHKYKMF